MPYRILILDSGVGGLSVAAEIGVALPGARRFYVADNGFFPYGTKPADALVRRVTDIVSAAASIRPDLVVVACNTASTVTLPALRTMLDVPVVGVVPAIKPAAALSRRGVIGLLGTAHTVGADYTAELIRRFAGACRVVAIGSPRLVEIAEGKLAGVTPGPTEIAHELLGFLTGDAAGRPDVIVLACTHFPLLRPELAAVLPESVKLIDSGTAIAARVRSLLGPDEAAEMPGGVVYFTAEPPTASLPAFRRYGFGEVRRLPLTDSARQVHAGAQTAAGRGL